MPDEWDLISLPSFNNAVEKYQLDGEKLNKWLEDLKKAPKSLKNAHPLGGPLKHSWGAHLNYGHPTYTALYWICDGTDAGCFLKKINVPPDCVDITKHKCEKQKGKIFLRGLVPHSKNYKL